MTPFRFNLLLNINRARALLWPVPGHDAPVSLLLPLFLTRAMLPLPDTLSLFKLGRLWFIGYSSRWRCCNIFLQLRNITSWPVKKRLGQRNLYLLSAVKEDAIRKWSRVRYSLSSILFHDEKVCMCMCVYVYVYNRVMYSFGQKRFRRWRIKLRGLDLN